MHKITKGELVARITTDLGETRARVERIIDKLIEHSAAALDQGASVAIRGFVKLTPIERAARTGRNPTTGEAVAIPARRAIRAKAAPGLLKSETDSEGGEI